MDTEAFILCLIAAVVGGAGGFFALLQFVPSPRTAPDTVARHALVAKRVGTAPRPAPPPTAPQALPPSDGGDLAGALATGFVLLVALAAMSAAAKRAATPPDKGSS